MRTIALLVLAGLGMLLAGVWWIQIVMGRTYKASLETQSYRTVRVPAVRGKLVDRNGVALAENRPSYNISLYLEELRKAFDTEYGKQVTQARAKLKEQAEARARELRRALTKEEKKQFLLSYKNKLEIRQRARAHAASNVVAHVSRKLAMKEPLAFDPVEFERHYQQRLALPYPVVRNLTPEQIAHFEEHPLRLQGVDLEVQSIRVYPFQTTAAHVLGRLQRDDSSMDGEESFFSYRLPDYRGLVGLEAVHDKQLRGSAGSKSVLVNNVGYRQTERVWVAAEPGQNLVLTIDQGIQEACERALLEVGAGTKGAVVVMEVNSGDILALASSPFINPNYFVQGFPKGEWQRIVEARAEVNRATQEKYAPGSVFKMVVGLAALESGLNPHAIHTAEPNPRAPGTALIRIGRHSVRDTAPPGPYDFKRAFKLSSNSYFVSAALRTGPARITKLGQRLHLGESTGLMPRQETSGDFPSLERVTTRWTDGNTANMSIGQDPVLVTPLQVAVLTSAIANGGKVYWPRLAARLEQQDAAPGEQPLLFPRAQLRDELGVSQRSLAVLHEAMLADVDDSDGTGKRAAVPGLKICGKTGTAQVKNEQNVKTGQITWFASFAPYDSPRWAVVVMVENGVSGGATCAPVAGRVYSALLEMERAQKGMPVAGVTR